MARDYRPTLIGLSAWSSPCPKEHQTVLGTNMRGTVLTFSRLNPCDPVSRISVDVFWWSAVAFGLKKEDYCCSVYLAQLYVYCASEGLIIRCNNDWTRKFFPNLFIWQAVCAMAGWYYWTDLRFDAYSVMTKTPDMVAMYLDDVGIQVRWPGKTGTEWHTRTLKITA